MPTCIAGDHHILGVDFSSAPGKHKAITVAVANLHLAKSQAAASLVVERVALLRTLDAFAALIAPPGPWLMGIDAPFSQPQPLVAALGWDRPATAADVPVLSSCQHGISAMQQSCRDAWRTAALHVGALEPPTYKAELQRFCDSQPPGQKHLKRHCDALAGAVSPISSVRTPVAQMYHRLAPMLAQAGVCVAPFMCGSAYDRAGMLDWASRNQVDEQERTLVLAAVEAVTTATSLTLTSAAAAAATSTSQQVDYSRVVVEVYPSLVARRLAAASLHQQGHEQAADCSASRPGASPAAAAVSNCTNSRKRARHAAAELVTQPGLTATAPAQPAPAPLPRHAPAYKGSNKDLVSSAAARQQLLQAAEQHCASLYGFELLLEEGVEEQCVTDSKGDVLDAVLAAMQAGWAAMQGPNACYGAPAEVQAEGWIHDPWMAAAYAHSAAQAAQPL